MAKTLTFIQPWHYSLDGFKTLRVGVGEVLELPDHLAATALTIGVAKEVAGKSAPLAEATKAAPAPVPTEEPVAAVQPEQAELPATAPAPKRSRSK